MNYDSSSDSKSLLDVFKRDNIINSTSQITSLYRNMSNNNSLYIGLFIVIIFTIIVALLLYSFLGWQLFSRIEQTVKDTKLPVVGTKLSKFIAEIAETANGARRSFSFWIYINDMNKYNGQYKNVLALTSNGNEYQPNLASPHIFLDKANNSMFIRFANKKKSTDNNDCPTINTNGNMETYMQQGIFIKYIPLQRWVNIIVVCNTDSFNTRLYAYVDGDLINTVVNDQIFDYGYTSLSTNKTKLDNINIDMSGYLYVGSDSTAKCGPGFSGLISNFTTFNYELNPKDIYKIYNKGPVNGLLARLGLAAYGVRTPIYKI